MKPKLLRVMLFVLLWMAPMLSKASRVDSLWREVAQQEKDSHLVKTYIQLSVAYMNNSYDSALQLARVANEMAIELGYDRGSSASFMRMGNAYSVLADYDSATWAYEQALQLFIQNNQILQISKAYNNLGLMYRYISDYPASADYFMKSLEIKKKHGTDIDVGVGYQNLGIVYAIQGEYDAAEKYIVQAMKSFVQAGDSVKYYSVLIDVSSLYREQGKFEESLNSLQKAYLYHQRKGNRTSMGICMYNMGLSSVMARDTTTGIGYYQKAKSLFWDLGNKVRVTGCNIRMGELMLTQGHNLQAETLCLEALELFDGFNSPTQEYKLYHLLSEAYRKQGKYKASLEQHLRYTALKDSIMEEDHQLKLKKLQTKHEKEVNRREILELSAANDRNQLIARKKKIENYILVGITLIVLMLAMMWYSRSRIKKRANDALREKNVVIQHSLDEKEVLLREIHHRVQNNLQFVSSLLNLQSRRVQDKNTLAVLRECKLRIQSMALIHQKLYQEHSLRGINFESYANNLLESLMQSYHIDSHTVQIGLEMDSISLDINTAIPMGLILNELITNAFKYAFKDSKNGILKVCLKEDHGVLNLSVKDNGPGLPKDFSFDENDSFGLKLVKSLALKLKADVEVESNQGTKISLHIKEYTITS